MEKRTVYCGALTEAYVGKDVSVCGWVQTKRDMGGVVFIDLKDREGTLQVVFDESLLLPEHFHIAENLKNQYVISVGGKIRLRSEDTVNPKIKTGTVELAADRLELLSESKPLPFQLEDAASVREDLRLKYRFLDIRREELQENLRFRHKVSRITRAYLDNDGFTEVETPYLTKSTPEGARDYLVPSRVHPGMFYALPQSPQIFKQLLMVGGMDKYYQIARCFRDEDLRADRQPEFTQVDMELSFVEQEDVLVHLEKLFKYIFKQALDVDISYDFPRITWKECMDTYGSDKPDLRFDLPIVDVTDIAAKSDFSVFKAVTAKGGAVRAVNVCGKSDFTRSQIEELTDKAVSYGAKGMAWIAVRPDGELYTILTKYFSDEVMKELLARVKAKPGDFILFCADKLATVRRVLGTLRNDLGTMLDLKRKDDYKLLFVTDFPEFEYSEEEERYVAMHHPFTMPYPEDLPYLQSDPERVRAQAYDVVLNGVELGSGSVRIHDRKIQQQMFKALGFTKEQTEERFGFMINAFRYGTPPHAGFAFGLDRLVMLMRGADSLRDVIAFPKTKDASCPMTEAPNVVDIKQLEELSLLSLSETVAADGTRVSAKKRSKKVDVDAVAALAKLRVDEDKKEKLEQDMEAVVDFSNALNALDTDGVPVREHLVPTFNVFREDHAAQSYTRAELLANAKTKTSEYITVPRVVE